MAALTMTVDRALPAGHSTSHENPPVLPTMGFDPVNNSAHAAQLDHFWLPPRPDPMLQPELYDHWREMLFPPRTFVDAASEEPPHAARPPDRDLSFTGRIRSRIQNSRNWSGVYVVPNRGNRFTRVAGRWTVPQVQAGVRTDGEANLPFQCSIWIGIDGKKRWTHSMPQVGSVQELDKKDDKTQTQDLWWQWWQRGESDFSSLPWKMKGVPISAGDVVLCHLMVMDPHRVRVHVVNRTTGMFATVQLTSTAKLVCSTAEWIVERPANWLGATPTNPAGPLFPMPDYKEVVIDKCVSVHRPEEAASAWLPRLIRLKETFSNPTRSAVISTPSIREEPPRTVRMRYRRP